MDNMMITTGYNFEGYRIVEYLGIVAADLFYRDYEGLFSFKKDSEIIPDVRADAIKELQRKTEALGGNAIIGYTGFLQNAVGEFSTCFSSTATAVRIEKV